MKKLFKILALLLAVTMLFAACTPDVQKPEKQPVNTFPMKKVIVDPDHPYDALHWGLHHDQTITVDGQPLNGKDVECETQVTYSIFIPQHGSPKTPCVLVLTPNNTKAEKFAESEIGKQWIEKADEGRFAVAFIEPYNGKEWNLKLEKPAPEDPNKKPQTPGYGGYPGYGTTAPKGPRDERIAVFSVVRAIREKAIHGDRAYLNVDKNSFGIVGYEEGASAAAIAAAAYPQVFANTTCINPVDFPTDIVKGLLDLDTFRHNDEYKGDAAKNLIPAKTIAMPMYVYSDKKDNASAESIVSIWSDVNKNALKEDSTAESKYYVSKMIDDGSVENVSKLATMNVRPRGYAGGTLRTRTDMWRDKGYEVNEGRIRADKGDDRIRRWSIYTPANLSEKEAVPLVVVLHGSSASITDIVDESKWSNVADKNGFIVLYCQGYPGSRDPHHPGWSFGQDDIEFILRAVDDVASKHNIDRSRMYLTGHSLGSMMTNTIMNDPVACKVFAAYGPCGAFSPANKDTPDTEIALWAMSGEWEFGGGVNRRTGKPNPTNDQHGEAWAARFPGSVKSEPVFEKGFTENKYKTWSFTTPEGNTPIKVTQVMDSPHVYMAEESILLWDWFKTISRDTETGKLVFAK